MKIQRYTFEKVGDGWQFTTTTDGLWVMAKDVEALERLQPMKDGDYAGTYNAGWNDALERGMNVPKKMPRGSGGAAYVKGFNACCDALRAFILRHTSTTGQP